MALVIILYILIVVITCFFLNKIIYTDRKKVKIYLTKKENKNYFFISLLISLPRNTTVCILILYSAHLFLLVYISPLFFFINS